MKTVPLLSYRINPTNIKNKPLFLKIVSTTPLVVEFQESNVGNPHTDVKRRFVTTDFGYIQKATFPIIPPNDSVNTRALARLPAFARPDGRALP